MTLPIACSADREQALRDMKRRFLLKDHGVRAVKDTMSRGAEG